MAEIMRMRKFLMFLNSVSVKIELNLWEHSLDSFFKDYQMAPKKFIMAEIMRMRKFLMLIASVGV